jgi:hypothetical protein
MTAVVTYSTSTVPTGKVMLAGNLGLGQFEYIPTTACTVNAAAKTLTCAYAYTNMWEMWGNNVYSITASYSGDGVYDGSTSAAAALTISTGTASSTTLSLSPAGGSYAVGTQVTATLVSTGVSGKGRPTGLVSVTPTGLGLPVSYTLPGACTATNSYTSTCVYTFTIPVSAIPGPYTVVASYSGDTTYNPSKGSAALFVLPSISFTSADHNFGSVPAGQSATYGVKMTNNQSVAFPISLGIEGSSVFTLNHNCGASLAAGASCEIVITYKPTTAGSFTANWATGSAPGITFYPSDGGTVTGTATPAGGVTLTSSVHDFGDLAIGSISGIYGVVLTNGTTDPVSLAMSVAGSTADFKTYINNCPATMLAGTSCNLQYEFTPQATGFEQEVTTIPVVDTITKSPVSITSGGSIVTGITLEGTGQ